MGVRSLKGTGRHLNNAGCCYEQTIVSVPRISRHYIILNSARQTYTCTHTVCIELDGGRQAGMEVAGKERGRM